MVCTAGDAVAAAAVSDMPVSASRLVSATVSTQNTDQHTIGNRQQTGLIISKTSSSYLSILELLCSELGLGPPIAAMSKKSEECTAVTSKKPEEWTATLSVKCGFRSSQSHATKADAKEDAARMALSALKVDVNSARNCRAGLNEYCQQKSAKLDYRFSESGPFTCTVFVPIVHTSLALATEDKAKDDAARGILRKLGRASHVLRMIDDPQFEDFSVSCDEFTLTARYRFSRLAVGDKSKKNAEKLAAEHALAVLYPGLDPKLSLDRCKGQLQEQYTEEKPKYVSVCGEDGKYYSDVSVTFQEQTSSDGRSDLDVADDLAKSAYERLHLA